MLDKWLPLRDARTEGRGGGTQLKVKNARAKTAQTGASLVMSGGTIFSAEAGP